MKTNRANRQIGQTFHFSPFSRKQKQVLTWWCKESPVHDMDGVIADGAIRSGKTISMSLSFVMWAMSTFTGQNFAMCGKTIGSFRRNVLFWLKLMLLSRGYSIADHRADNLLTIRKDGKENYFYIFGGKDERSQDLIQGITLVPYQLPIPPIVQLTQQKQLRPMQRPQQTRLRALPIVRIIRSTI